MLALGRYSRWPRSELRQMQPAEFADYLETAKDIAEESSGS